MSLVFTLKVLLYSGNNTVHDQKYVDTWKNGKRGVDMERDVYQIRTSVIVRGAQTFGHIMQLMSWSYALISQLSLS